MTITVRDDRPSAVPADFSKAATAPRLFSLAEGAIVDRVAGLVVRYDARYGFPRLISIDRDKDMFDEEIAFSVRGFRPISER